MKPAEDLMKLVDLKAAKLDPNAKYLFVGVVSEPGVDCEQIEQIRRLVQAGAPNAAVIIFSGEIECRLYDIGDKPGTSVAVKQAQSLIQDRESSRRI